MVVVLLQLLPFLITPCLGEWAFLGGSKGINSRGSYFNTDRYWPSGRTNPAYFYKNGVLYMYGGSGYSAIPGGIDDCLSDLWEFHVSNNSWITKSEPKDVGFVGNLYQSTDNYGEWIYEYNTFRTENWPVSSEGAKLFLYDEILYLFSGGVPLNETQSIYYMYSLTMNAWAYNKFNLNNVNALIFYSSAVYFDIELSSIYLLGSNDKILVGNMSTRYFGVFKNFTYPLPLFFPGSYSDYDNHLVYLFSGDSGSSVSNVLIVYNVRSGISQCYIPQSTLTPSGRRWSSIVKDEMQNRILLFGGADSNLYGYSDLWSFNLIDIGWDLISGTTELRRPSKFGSVGIRSSTVHPGQRIAPVLFYDEIQDCLYVFGGDYANDVSGTLVYLNDLWVYYFTRMQVTTISTSGTYESTIRKNSQYFSLLGKVQTSTSNNLTIYVSASLSAIFVLLLYASYKLLSSRRKGIVVDQAQATSLTNITTNQTILTSDSTELKTISEPSHNTLFMPAFRECHYSDFKLVKELAHGSMGNIYIAQGYKKEFEREDGKSLIIVKLIGKVDVKPPEEVIKGFIQEVSIMEMFSKHPNCAEMLGFCYNPLCILLKYYEHGTLNAYLKANSVWTKNMKLNMVKDISMGITCIHDHDIVHCDLKSDNVLLDYNTTMNRLVCVITDFGISRIVSSKILKVQSFSVSEIRGFSYSYSAPEVFQSRRNFNQVNKSRDIYAFGILIGELLTIEEPWGDAIGYLK